MGARWPWHAICENGHINSGFSGGSNGVCEMDLGPPDDICEAPILEETDCGMYSESCNCEEYLKHSWREFDNNRRQLKLF